MTFLGIIAGMFACFFTRIIKKNMIFKKFGKYLERINNNSWLMNKEESLWVKFIRCGFCLSPWLVFMLEIFYIIEFSPRWIYAFIGILGGLGAGNFVCELVHSIRNEE